MKHKLMVLAAASAVAGPVAAQSSVTMFGVLDLAARSVSNEGLGSVKSLVSGANATSRIAFRGVEDLGDGLSAGFHLESGVAADTGASVSATQFFDRRATLSLASKSVGELRAGRDFVPTYTNWSRYDPFGYVGVASSSNLITATPVGPIRSTFGTSPNTTVRSSNSIQYLLPGNLGGLEGGLMVAAGEGGLVTDGAAKVISARLGYSAGPFSVSAAMGTSENSLTTAGKFKDNAIGGSYNAGIVKVSAAWRQFKYASAKQTNILVGASVPMGAHEVKFSWNSANLDGNVGANNIAANDSSQFGLGYVYSLSKRSVLYASAARVSNKGVATHVVPGGAAGIAGGRRSTGFEAGVRHSF
ncbi:MAG: porin [Burkholderiaceae bacterium]